VANTKSDLTTGKGSAIKRRRPGGIVSGRSPLSWQALTDKIGRRRAEGIDQASKKVGQRGENALKVMWKSIPLGKICRKDHAKTIILSRALGSAEI